MIAAKVSQLESLRMGRIRELAESPGPCITICLPPHRPGEQSLSADALLKTNLRDATRQLEARRMRESEIADLLAPLHAMAEDPELGGSHWTRMIFRSPQAFQQFSITAPMNPAVTVASCFEIRPLLAELPIAQEFYILALSQKRVSLLRGSDFRAERVSLPKGVPDNLEEALALKAPDHDLENRSASAASAKRGIRFGTLSDREKHRAYLADFYRAIDRGMHELLHGRGCRLVLAGVDEDTAAYSAINTYPKLLNGTIRGSLVEETEMLQQAYGMIRREEAEREARDLAESKERVAPARFPMEVNRILHAAVAGQVERLYLAEDAQKIGHFHDKQTGVHTWEKEDLLNFAAVETILHSGQVFILPAAKMPEGTAAAALLRF